MEQTQYTTYKTDTSGTGKINEKSNSVSAHKLRLINIRQKLLKAHEEQGLIRNKPDLYYDQLPITQLKAMLEAVREKAAGISETEFSIHQKKNQPSKASNSVARSLSIAGHGHLLVTVSCIYDPAFYYSPEEFDGVDVQSLVERPELHILGRWCTSSLEALFNQYGLQ